MINRKPHGRRSAAVPAHDVQEAPIDPSPQGDVHDQDLACAGPVQQRRRKAVDPKPHPWESPEFIRSLKYATVFFDLMDAVEKRDLARVKEYQAKLLEDWGLVVELADDWETKWPASPPEPEAVPDAEM
jgi:hypothetical protein